jgi:hypothetical protein
VGLVGGVQPNESGGFHMREVAAPRDAPVVDTLEATAAALT